MATHRSLPTNFFGRPGIRGLSTATQLTLTGLILCADDAGRGPLDMERLSRMLQHSPDALWSELDELEAAGLVQTAHDFTLHCYPPIRYQVQDWHLYRDVYEGHLYA